MDISGVETGDQVVLREGSEVRAAVRAVDTARGRLVIWIENAGEFTVPADMVVAVHDGKVRLDLGRVPDEIERAFQHGRDAEQPGL